jgi:hypothetical protein
MGEDTLFEGGVNIVRRRGDRVYRPMTAATRTVHRLLRHLRTAGFTGAVGAENPIRTGQCSDE